VAWQGPWLTAVIASAVGLWCIPFYSFLEGCGQIRAVAGMRLRQSSVAAALAWTAMLLHHGLYAPTLVIAGQVGAGLAFVATHRRLLAGLLRHPAGESSVQWSSEVWPFQWRIAISWMCSCFTVQMFVPILFAIRGAVEAGQMGMSLSITTYMGGLALAWSSTKTTPFGRMVARHEFQQLDRLFSRTLAQSMTVFAMMAFCATGVAELLPMLAPSLAARIVSPLLLGLMFLGSGASCIVQSVGNLLRSFKSEPFLVQSLVSTALTLALVALTAPRWGNTGTVFGYVAASVGIGLPFALVIFIRARRLYLASGSGSLLQGEPV